MRERMLPDFRRKRIEDENLLQYKAQIKLSDRNKQIVEEYVAGASETELGKKYGVSTPRIAQIIESYVLHAVKIRKGLM